MTASLNSTSTKSQSNDAHCFTFQTPTWAQMQESIDHMCEWCDIVCEDIEVYYQHRKKTKQPPPDDSTFSITIRFMWSTSDAALLFRLCVENDWYRTWYVYADADNIAARYIAARGLVWDVNSSQAYTLIRKCMEDCSHHKHCPRPQPSKLPRRVIDCADPTHPRLVESESLGKERYAALSYVWGQEQPHSTKEATIEPYRHSIDRRLIPKTILDAITVTSQLGLRYLWVDSFCIIQDSDEDKNCEIPQIRHTFQHAHVTIVAADAQKVSDGFLHNRKKWPFAEGVVSEVKEWSVKLKSPKSVYGEVTGGFLLLSAIVKPVIWNPEESELFETTGGGDRALSSHEESMSGEMGYVVADAIEPASDSLREVFAAVLKDTGSTFLGIILEPTWDDDKGRHGSMSVYRRIGWFTAPFCERAEWLSTEYQHEGQLPSPNSAEATIPATAESRPVRLGEAPCPGPGRTEVEEVRTNGGLRDTRLALWSPDGEEIKALGEHACNLGGLPAAKIIFDQALSSVRVTTGNEHHIDLTQVATPCRYRFIDCLEFVHREFLQVIEVCDLPRDAYAAISHVWASALPKSSVYTQRGSFLVECEERNDGGPISIDVLHHACVAALQEGVRFLWLDRLCILQTHGKGENVNVDKKWQIMHMHDIYRQCHVTLVLSAGLRRFPDKFEATTWVERAWTFQEAMVAPGAKVLFVDYNSVSPEDRSPVVHMLPIDEYFKMQPTGNDDHTGALERQRQFVQALDSRSQFRSNDPGDILARYQSIWDFVQWRSSARQADVVFSVMAMLGVTLDPSKFEKHDRLGATLALAQEMLLNDPRENTCVDIPMWRKVDKADVLDTCKRNNLPPYNVHDYLMRLPTIVQTTTQLEGELSREPIPGFGSRSKRSLLKGSGGEEDTEKRLHSDIENMKRRADNLAQEIPSELLEKARDGKDETLTPFKTSHNVVIGLCKQLHPGHPVVPHQFGHVFGWSIQDVLWLQLTRQLPASNQGEVSPSGHTTSRRPRTIPVPVVTFWKFTIPGDVSA
ncbi:hypothetical protein AN958_04290 [Leucoagaricus sp. SymC.cos]|nr:hypothetical protein AN958_04290 [Leucoagaricus sp. SymC.cos]